MLLNSFFRMSGSVRARGYVIFESSTPGQYDISMKRQKRTLRCDCVGGGAAGFVGRIALKINAGTPSETTFIGSAGISGCSGAYTTRTGLITMPARKIRAIVGSGGTAYYTTNIVETFNIGSYHEYWVPDSVGGTESVVKSGWYGDVWSTEAHASKGQRSSLLLVGADLSWKQHVSTGNTIDSKLGQYPSSESPSNVYLAGGSSTYGGYGAGGSAGWGGQYPSETPWGNNGVNGYVKITVAD